MTSSSSSSRHKTSARCWRLCLPSSRPPPLRPPPWEANRFFNQTNNDLIDSGGYPLTFRGKLRSPESHRRRSHRLFKRSSQNLSLHPSRLVNTSHSTGTSQDYLPRSESKGLTTSFVVRGTAILELRDGYAETDSPSGAPREPPPSESFHHLSTLLRRRLRKFVRWITQSIEAMVGSNEAIDWWMENGNHCSGSFVSLVTYETHQGDDTLRMKSESHLWGWQLFVWEGVRRWQMAVNCVGKVFRCRTVLLGKILKYYPF